MQLDACLCADKAEHGFLRCFLKAYPTDLDPTAHVVQCEGPGKCALPHATAGYENDQLVGVEGCLLVPVGERAVGGPALPRLGSNPGVGRRWPDAIGPQFFGGIHRLFDCLAPQLGQCFVGVLAAKHHTAHLAWLEQGDQFLGSSVTRLVVIGGNVDDLELVELIEVFLDPVGC